MNRILKIFATVFLGMLWYACSPDENHLGSIDVKTTDLAEGIAFKIEHDATNPNIVYLESLMDGKYTPIWEHPQGRSQAQKVTLQIPFPGTYTVKFGVETRGGSVYGDEVTFTVDEMYAPFISDPMWTMLAGGSGKEKTWYLDLDAEGLSRKFLGPIYFFRKWYTWDGLHTASGDNYIDADSWIWKNAILPTLEREGEVPSGAPQDGVPAWYWTADWKGNQWMTAKADFGTMTFDLKGAANVKVDQDAYGLGLHTGSYLINTETKTLTFTDVKPLHDSNRDAGAFDWKNVRILYLSDVAMQLGVVPDGEKDAMVVYNYISKDYKDNWVPPVVVAPEPPYKGVDPNSDLTTSTSTKKKWTLSLNTPYNWTGLGGNFLNGWSSPADYAATGWAPYDATLIGNVSLIFNKVTSTTGSYKFTDSKTNEITGSYTLDDKNNITFDQNITFPISGWVSLATTADNKLRIIKTETDAFGNISKLWLGQRSTEKDEYMVFAFEPGGTVTEEATPTEIAFDNTKLIFGDIEKKGKLRLEFYNEYGGTKANPPLNPADLIVKKRITIKFTLGGITLKSGAKGSYQTAISLADADWSPQYWGDGTGPGEASVTGNGTYTIWYEPTTTSEGAAVFVIDIPDLATDIQDLTTVTATVNSIKVL